MALRTRKPTGTVPWPLILIEGGEKAGKSWACAELSASPRVGQTYWIDLGEGSADEYGAVPGARYLVVEHDGSYREILAAVVEIKAEAARAASAGEPPVVLVIDSMTAEWELLKGIADADARRRLAKKGRAAAPDQEIKPDMDLWIDANKRHRRIMNELMTFPGIVVVTARGKEIVAVDDSGRPIPRAPRDYKVEGHKTLGYDVSVWVRVSRDRVPLVVGARSVHAGIRPGVDEPRPMPEMSLERVVFDVLRCDPAAAHVRDLTALQVVDDSLGDQDATEAASASLSAAAGLSTLIQAASNKDELGDVYRKVAAAERSGQISPEDAALLAEAWNARKTEVLGDQVVDKQHRHMHALWRQAGITDRDQRLRVTCEVIGRTVTSSSELTAAEGTTLINHLNTLEKAGA